MTRRPSNIMSSSQARAQANRLARANEVKPFVSFDAVCNIIERECDKAGRRWYGAMTEVANEIEAIDPATRKEARLLVLDRLDRFPVREAS